MAEVTGGRHPHLRRRLLLTLLLPMLSLLVIDTAVTYGVALNYANRVHDADLTDDLRTLAQMLRSGKVAGDLPQEARLLLEPCDALGPRRSCGTLAARPLAVRRSIARLGIAAARHERDEARDDEDEARSSTRPRAHAHGSA